MAQISSGLRGEIVGKCWYFPLLKGGLLMGNDGVWENRQGWKTFPSGSFQGGGLAEKVQGKCKGGNFSVCNFSL